jgi:hypothetical protein
MPTDVAEEHVFMFRIENKPSNEPAWSRSSQVHPLSYSLVSPLKEKLSPVEGIARYWLLVAVLTVQFVPHRKHTPSP